MAIELQKLQKNAMGNNYSRHSSVRIVIILHTCNIKDKRYLNRGSGKVRLGMVTERYLEVTERSPLPYTKFGCHLPITKRLILHD